MGRPVKLSDQKKEWFLRSQRRHGRILDAREERQRFLIVCEGEKTEPNYFEALKKELPPHVIELQIHGEGANTLSLVSRAQQLREKGASPGLPFDQVWVVFDRDSFEADDFDNAIHKAEAGDIQCAWSNEAFELWYVLHFEYRNTPMPREEYKRKLTRLLDREYRKNAPDMYLVLSKNGNEAQAIARSRRLYNGVCVARTPLSKANPCTTVFKLVEELNRYRPLQEDQGVS